MSHPSRLNEIENEKNNTKIYDNMKIMTLGGGQEVGRSCIYLEFKERRLLLDCGSHPGIEGSGSLPFFDELDDIAAIDIVLITHFHIDHCAALPYFTEKTRGFRGKIFMTHATKAVMKLLLNDNIKLQVKNKPLYNEQDLENCIDKIEVVDYYQTIEYKGMKITATKAGHVLGACMYTIEIDGIKVLYTGDYSMEEDRHLPPADFPIGSPPDLMIVESTFGTTTLGSKEDREDKFIRTVEAILSRRGSCLIPVFALGRAQELLLILEDLWRQSPRLQSIPIYFASKLANKALKIYQTFVNMMNSSIQTAFDLSGNPFSLQHINKITANVSQDCESILGSGSPCVVMASPGFLQSGISRYLFERWCDDPRCGVIIAGYTVEGTLAHSLLSSPSEIICLDNRKKPVKCLIENISFSAHVDFIGNLAFIKRVNPGNIILVHGEKTQMLNLKRRLESEIRNDPHWGQTNGQSQSNIPLRKPAVVNPSNGQPVLLRFPRKVIASVYGSAAMNILNYSNGISNVTNDSNTPPLLANDTVLVTEQYTSKILARSDLPQFTSCRPLKLLQRLFIPISKTLLAFCKQMNILQQDLEEELLKYIQPYLQDIFDEIQIVSTNTTDTNHPNDSKDIITQSHSYLQIQQVVDVHVNQDYSNVSDVDETNVSSGWMYIIEWNANPLSDMFADSISGMILQCMSTSSLLRSSLSSVCTPTNLMNSNSLKRKLKVETNSIIKKEVLSINPFQAVDINDNKQRDKLENLVMLLKEKDLLSRFQEVKLNSQGNKLIFRSLPNESNEVNEAFCFIQFDTITNKHEASIYSESDLFRRKVIDILQLIDTYTSNQ